MASPITGLDDDFLKKLLAQFGASDADKASAKSNAWIQTGLGLLAASQSPYKQGLLGGAASAVGKAGQQGMQYYDEQLNQAQARKAAAMRTGSEAMTLAGQADAFQQMQQKRMLDKKFEDEQRAKEAGAAPPSVAPSAQMAPMAPDMAGATQATSQLPPPPGPPGIPQTQQGPAVPATLTGRMAGVSSAAQAFIDRGNFYQKNNRTDLATGMYEEARKLMPKNKEVKTLTDPATGKRVTVGIDEYGQPTVLPFDPDAEKLHFADNNTSIQGLDPFNAKPVGAAIPKFQSPDSQATVAESIREHNMMDARQRELRADSLAQQGKPQIVSGANGEVFAVDPRTGTGKEVTGLDGNPLNKGSKMTETQANATAFGMRMNSANEIVNKLEDSGYNVTSPTNLLAANPVSNYVASKEAQSLYQAKLNFMSASLRKESGAAISQSEYESENKKYFPQPGDTKETIKQKRDARNLALEAMAAQASPSRPKPQEPTKSRNVTVQW